MTKTIKLGKTEFTYCIAPAYNFKNPWGIGIMLDFEPLQVGYTKRLWIFEIKLMWIKFWMIYETLN